jgi:hypothetical protein
MSSKEYCTYVSKENNPFKEEAQTALFKDPARTAL